MYSYGKHCCTPYSYGYPAPVYSTSAYPAYGGGAGIVLALLVVLFIFLIILGVGAARYYR